MEQKYSSVNGAGRWENEKKVTVGLSKISMHEKTVWKTIV